MKKTLLAKAALTLLAMLFSITGARAIVTHTVYNGTATNTVVPVQGSQVGSNYIRSQFIIPKDQLAIMADGKISHMIFHADEDVVNWYAEAQFKVYVSETDDVSFTSNSYKTWNANAVVYSGKLAVNGKQLIVDFNSDFYYSGNKNLLIGIYQTSKNTNNTSTFYGQSWTTGNYTSIGGYSNSANSDGNTINRYRFLPKTTFVYTPGFIPTNMTVAKEVVDVPTTGGDPETVQSVNATISWEGDADSYEIRYRTRRELFSEDFSRGIPSTWTIRKGSGAYGNGWIGENGQAASYSWYNYNVYTADNWLITPKVQLGGILTFDVSVSAWHDIYEVKLSTTGIAEADFTNVVRELTPGIPGTEDFDLKDYQGQEGYIAFHHKNKDGYWLDIDNFKLTSGHAWKYATSTTNSVKLERLLPDLEYEYVVIGIKHDDVNNVDVRGEAPNKYFSTLSAEDIIIPDDEDNESMLYDLAGKTYNAFLENRSFKDKGIWNTLCLPFDVTVAGSPFEDALIYTVTNRSYVHANGKLVLRIDPVTPTKLTAGTPYLITWEGAKTVFEPFFRNVTFKNETNPITGSVTGGTSIVFTPNFKLLNFATADESVLFLSNNNLYSAGVGAKIKPQRAYFKTTGGSSVRGIAFEIEEDDADAINDVNANLNGNANIFNVAGQRMSKMQKGINIVNGKKIIIK